MALGLTYKSIAFNNNIGDRRLRGRPRSRRFDKIKKDLGVMNFDPEQWMEIAKDRRWFTVVEES